MPALTVARDGVVEYRIELGKPVLRIGRNRDNEVVLPDPTKSVSRVHAELREESGGYVLVDLNSQNGTWVDGRRIDHLELQPGMAAAIGPYTLMLEGAQPVMPQAESRWGAARSAAVTPASAAGAARRAPAEPAPARRTAPAAGRRPAPERPQGAGPIAWLARQSKPRVLLAFLVVTLLALGVVHLLSPGDPPAAPTAPASAPPAGGNTRAVSELLDQGRARLQQGDAEGALGLVERALTIKPDDPEALDLKMKAEEQRRTGAASPAQPPGGRR